MPTYEYACSACNHQWEEVQKISEPPLEVCPSCTQATAKRQISGGNFILKGGGWYADLYSSSSNKSEKKPAGEGATESKPSEGAKPSSDTKPDTGTKSQASGSASVNAATSKSESKVAAAAKA
jgi:putative FmdB family regulatory protein